jgi:hypothetical protein
MTRVRVKGIGSKLAPSPATEPNFYLLPPCYENNAALACADLENFTKQLLLAAQSDSPSTGTTASIGMAKPCHKKSADSRVATGGTTNEAKYHRGQRIQRIISSDDVLPCTVESSFIPSLEGIPTARSWFTDGTSASGPLDLTPLPTSSQRNYLLEIKDDILEVLMSTRSSSDESFSASFMEASKDQGNLSNLGSNFWEL